MKMFSSLVIVATLVCLLVNLRETQGQLSFNMKRRRCKEGRSLVSNDKTDSLILFAPNEV